MNTLRESTCQFTNGTVYYWHTEIDAKKQTLFFLHGLTANHTMFEKQVEYFKDNYNLIVWDAPMHGKSRPYADFSMRNAVNVMLQILNDLRVDEVVLIGQSLGGYFAQAFIARYPHMVKAFVSIDSTPYGNYYSKSDIWWLKQVEWMAKLYSGEFLKRSMAKQCALTKAGRDNMYNMIKDYTKNELCELMGIGYAGFLEDNHEMDISCPVLFLVGEKDKTGKVAQYNRMWSKATGIVPVWIPNAAHNSNVDNPSAVNDCIRDFLKELTIAACGNDCASCPRFLAKSKEELRHTAELWMQIGYRDSVVSNDEIACNGCKPGNQCRYAINSCVREHNISNCGQCKEYSCKKIKECFAVTDTFAPGCEKVCSKEEYEMLKKAFYCKEENLDKIYKINTLKEMGRRQ